MVRKQIHEYLSSIFSIPIVHDILQTKTEKSIGYTLSEEIGVRYSAGSRPLIFDFSFYVNFRCPNGFEGIGFLTSKLSETNKIINGFKLKTVSGHEKITHQSITEMIISKKIHAQIVIDYNLVKEKIKKIEMVDDKG